MQFIESILHNAREVGIVTAFAVWAPRPRNAASLPHLTGNNGGGAAVRLPAFRPVRFLMATHLLFFSFAKALGQKASLASINNAQKLLQPMEQV